MKTQTHIKRRSFFKISAVAGGGFLLGFNWLAACKNTEEIERLMEMPSEWYDMNAYLKIGNNGVVTIFSPNPEIGQNVKTSMPMIVAEELDVPWHTVLVEQGKLDTDVFTRQVAGGSQSIRQGWNGLRKAGATARQMLVNAAAQQWNVDPSECTTKEGNVYGPMDQSANYGELAAVAATLEVPEEVTLKDPKDFTIIGSSRKNVDLNDIVTGKPLFGIDTQREGMKYACVLRPPAFGRKLKSFDDATARQVNGVTDVISFGNKIAVIGNGTWPVMKGKKALVAQWEEGTKAESTSDHDREMLALLDAAENLPMRNDGNVEKAFAEADNIVERIYESPFLPHNCMEPMNFYANVTDEKVYLHGPIQTPAWARSRVAKILDRPEEEIEVTMTRMGGGFGRRLYGDFSDEAAEISSLAKAPIQLIFTREDDMSAGTYRVALKYKIRAAIKDGDITGYRLAEAASNGNMYGLIPHFFPAGAIANYQVVGHSFPSNITTGAWRAPYTNFLAFAEQSFFDELAEELKTDAVDLRIDLLERAKPVAETDENIQYSPERLQGVLRLVAEKAGWNTKGSDVYQGVSAYYSHNTHVAEIAEVVMDNGHPVISKVYCAVDCGRVINRDAATNQVEGGIIDGIGHAMYGDFSFDKGKPSANNFHQYRLIRNAEAPEIEVHFVDSEIDPTGLGEPSLPPAGGAVANALYKATGQRLYKQPFVRSMEILG